MELTLQDVIARLDVDEPDYAALSVMGPEALPHLRSLIAGEDAQLAAKAVYLASLIDDPSAAEALEEGVESEHDVVRVAAAAALPNLAPERATPLTEQLLADPDAGVRKLAVRSVSQLGLSSLEEQVQRMSSEDPEEALRSIAEDELTTLRRQDAERSGT